MTLTIFLQKAKTDIPRLPRHPTLRTTSEEDVGYLKEFVGR